MEEEHKKDEEGLEEILDEMSEEELDKKLEETFKDDILSEDEIKSKFTHMNTAIVSDNVSTLKDRGMMPIENLEDKLKKDDEEDNAFEPQEVIEYGMTEDDKSDINYIKPEMSSIANSVEEMNRSGGKRHVQNINEISREISMINKNTKIQYKAPEELKIGELPREDKKAFIKDFRKLSEDYKTQ